MQQLSAKDQSAYSEDVLLQGRDPGLHAARKILDFTPKQRRELAQLDGYCRLQLMILRPAKLPIWKIFEEAGLVLIFFNEYLDVWAVTPLWSGLGSMAKLAADGSRRSAGKRSRS